MEEHQEEQLINLDNVSLALRNDIREELKSDAAASIVSWLTTISEHFKIDRDEIFKLLEIDQYDLNVSGDNLFSLKDGVESYRKRNKVKDPKKTIKSKSTIENPEKAKATKKRRVEPQMPTPEPLPAPTPTPNTPPANMECDVDELTNNMSNLQFTHTRICEYERAKKKCEAVATMECQHGKHAGQWVCDKHTSWNRKMCQVQGCGKLISHKDSYCAKCKNSLD